MGSDQSRANRRNDSLSGSTGSNGTTPTKYDVYQSNSSTLSRDRTGHEGEHFAMQRSSKALILISNLKKDLKFTFGSWLLVVRSYLYRF